MVIGSLDLSKHPTTKFSCLASCAEHDPYSRQANQLGAFRSLHYASYVTQLMSLGIIYTRNATLRLNCGTESRIDAGSDRTGDGRAPSTR